MWPVKVFQKKAPNAEKGAPVKIKPNPNGSSTLASNDLPANFGNQSFSYDSEGRLSSVLQHYGSNRSATTSYEFDTLDRTSRIYYPAQYGQSGNPVRQAEPTYDLASRLKKLTYNSIVMADNPVYNASSQTTQLDIGSAIQELYTFDPQTGLLTNQKVKQGATTHVDLSYDYGNLYAGGNATWKTGQLSKIIDNKITNGSRNREYNYDKLGRLTKVKGGLNGGLWEQAYSYDRWGNRTGITQTGTSGSGGAFIPMDGLASLSYNTATNRITTGSFAYDAAGNQTQSNENGLVNNYKYDAAGRLVEVSNSIGTHTYAYGASNQRLQMVEAGANGSTTLYVWAGGQTIAEYNGVGSGMAWTKSYVYLGGRLLATDSTSGVQYHHPDRLGTRLVTNTSGGIVSENIGLPFGTTITGESYNLAGSASKKRFTSYDRSDTTKLDYAVNRHYSAAQGRFTQVDPIEMEAVDLSDPQSLNLYAYCVNDPVNHLDPDGLFLKKLFRSVKKFFSNIIVKIAVVIALTVISLGLLGPLTAPTIVSELGFSIGGATTAAVTSGVHLTLTGWLAVGLSALSGISLPMGFRGPGGFARTPGINGNTGVSGVNGFMQGDGPKMGPAPPDKSTWASLFLEWLTGTGPETRQFGPDSKLTQELRTSPDIPGHRAAFCAKNFKTIRPYKGGVRFGLNAKDGPWTAGTNMTRQFVGSFSLTITSNPDGSAIFEAKNVTSRRSAFYHIPFGDWGDAKTGLGANKTQIFWWKEEAPCRPIMRARK